MPETAHSRLRVALALIAAGAAGGLVAVQTRINGGLSREIGNGYLAAAVSFGVGLVIMFVALGLSSRGREGLRRVRVEIASRRLPVWALAGGACGAYFVLGQGLVASVTGVALFTIGIVGGQVLGGLLMDRIGLGPGGRVRPSGTRVVGTVLALVAVALSVAGDLFESSLHSAQLLLMLVPITAGIGIAWQSAMNGVVRSAAHSALTATFINFVVGTALLVIAAGISVGISGWPESWPTAPGYYVGGFVGTIFIAIAALIVRTSGVLLLSMSNVAGQLVASVLLDLGAPLVGGVSAGLLAGASLALVAVIVAALPARRRLRSDRAPGESYRTGVS